MAGSRAFGVVVSGCSLVAVGCSLLVSTSDLTEGSADAGSADASTPLDGGAAGLDASILAEAGADGKALPPGSVVWSGNGHAYLVVSRSEGFRWSEADAESRRLGGHLVTIQSANESAFVFKLLGPLGPNSWLGGFQPVGATEPDGGWTWVTGEPMTFTNWASGQPNNLGGDEDVIHFRSDGDGLWSDEDADAKTEGFVVELE